MKNDLIIIILNNSIINKILISVFAKQLTYCKQQHSIAVYVKISIEKNLAIFIFMDKFCNGIFVVFNFNGFCR